MQTGAMIPLKSRIIFTLYWYPYDFYGMSAEVLYDSKRNLEGSCVGCDFAYLILLSVG